MDVSAVKAQIKNKDLQKFYIFTGPEIYVSDTYIKKIAEVSGKMLFRTDTVGAIYNVRGKSILNTSYCYVVRDDKEFMTYEKAWDTIEQTLGDNMLILLVTQIDKRSKFYKRFKDQIVEFEYLKEDMIVKYIQKKIQLKDESCRKLAEICEYDLNRIFLEIDKIQQYSFTVPVLDYDEILNDLLDEGTIYQPPKDAVFDLVDAILKRDLRKSFKLLADCRGVGEANMVILYNLYNTTRNVLQIQSCKSPDIAKTTGLNGWQIKNAKNLVGHYNISELVNALKIIREVEKGIKTGAIDDDISVEYVMVNIF